MAESSSVFLPDFLWQEIDNRVQSRLQMLKVPPKTVLELLGIAPKGQLSKSYPEADHLVFLLEDELHLPFSDASMDWVCCNGFFAAPEKRAVWLAEILRVLRPEGLFMAALPAAKLCQEIHDAIGQLDKNIPPQAVINLRNLGDELMAAGFVDPVVDSDRLYLTYRQFDTLFSEWAGCFEINKRNDANFQKSLETVFPLTSGSLSLTADIIYISAWRGENLPNKNTESTGAEKENTHPLRFFAKRD